MVEIIIREDGTNTSVSNATGNNGGARGKDKEQGKPKETQVNVNALLIDYTKQIITFGVNTAFDISGNNIMKDRISSSINIGADMIMLLKGGWIGAGAVALKYGATAIQSYLDISREQYKVNMLKEQAGKVIELGGRYSND